MVTFTEIERVLACEVNPVVTPPFSTTLPPLGTVNLCEIVVPIGRDRDAFLINAVVNWSVTFTGLATPAIATAPGFAQVTFELLRDGGPVFRVIETAGQVGVNTARAFIGPSTTFVTTTLLHLDTLSLSGATNPISTFILRATNIILMPPLTSAGLTAGTVTAATGAVTLIVEEVEARRATCLKI